MARSRTSRRYWPLAIVVLALPVAASAALPSTLASSDATVLRPGQFLWDETDNGTGPVSIMVSIDRQYLYVYRDTALIGVSTISTGKPGKATPMGEFRILQKNVFHRSNLYSNAPMPYMQRLTWSGIAIHGGQLPGYPASHGCIRVPLEFAKKLFATTDMGGIVSVSDGQSGPFLRIEVDVAALQTDGQPTWNPAARQVRLAEAGLPVVLPVKRRGTPDLAKATPPRSVRIALDASALKPKPQSETVTASQENSQPHWLVPYFKGN